MEKLEKVKMKCKSLISLIESYKGRADWRCGHLSRAEASEPIDASDREIIDFALQILNGVEKAELIVSDIRWDVYGNHVDDELYPVIMKATKLPDGRYYLEVTGIWGIDEYIWEEI